MSLEKSVEKGVLLFLQDCRARFKRVLFEARIVARHAASDSVFDFKAGATSVELRKIPDSDSDEKLPTLFYNGYDVKEKLLKSQVQIRLCNDGMAHVHACNFKAGTFFQHTHLDLPQKEVTRVLVCHLLLTNLGFPPTL